ncbi:phospholipase A1-like [Venturia canescens]|uniref:phospholipase A1-like n=1 Tax=Venturia canescens TaxID=32260 RepID=UPI001C9D5813|nr:phospholipase A1-like [Venturia canescens]
MVSQNISRRRRFACPKCLIGLNHFSVFSIITTTLLGNAVSQSLDDNSILQDTSSSSNNSIKFFYLDGDYFIGPCRIHTKQSCPDEEVTFFPRFFLYTRDNPSNAQQIRVNGTWSNLIEINYSKNYPTKIVIHGYNSNMHLSPLVDIKNEYLKKEPANLIAVDWHRLAAGPCYPMVVYNVPHVGHCVAQLIERLRDVGTTDIHVIGFSLGAQISAFSANVLKPYKIPRITGLDPAKPLFVQVDNNGKLDAGDAEFVDVYHTNAFIQGQIKTSGHIDFYMNGGINQPGCWQEQAPFNCSHHRSADYFAESINTRIGFWGWPCPGYAAYLFGLCPPKFPAVLAGDNVDAKYRGFFLVETRAEAPFAMGPFSVNASDVRP